MRAGHRRRRPQQRRTPGAAPRGHHPAHDHAGTCGGGPRICAAAWSLRTRPALASPPRPPTMDLPEPGRTALDHVSRGDARLGAVPRQAVQTGACVPKHRRVRAAGTIAVRACHGRARPAGAGRRMHRGGSRATRDAKPTRHAHTDSGQRRLGGAHTRARTRHRGIRRPRQRRPRRPRTPLRLDHGRHLDRLCVPSRRGRAEDLGLAAASRAAFKAPPSCRSRPTPWSRRGRRRSTVDTAGWAPGDYLLRLDADSGAQQYVPLTVKTPSNAGRLVVI